MGKQKWRLGVLAGVLLVSLAYLLFGSGHYRPWEDAWWSGASGQKPVTLPGENQVASARLVTANPYLATVEVEYFYNGAAGPFARLHVVTDGGDVVGGTGPAGSGMVAPGRQKVTVALNRVAGPTNDAAAFGSSLHTQLVKVRLSAAAGTVLVENSFAEPIDWPSSDPFVLSGTTATEIDRLYRLCVETIDQGRDLDRAKKGLEQIVLADPQFVPAYAELARYQMKTNWSHAGLAQAEQSLRTALRIDPNHANTLVLIGYVFAHQHRFKDAEDAFRKAEAAGTRNIWLYANWGELRVMEGRRKAAIEIYRKAIEAPKDLETYERARQDAYENLLVLLVDAKQWQEADSFHQERIARYPDSGCYRASHAAFRLGRRGDYDSAITIGTKALEKPCMDGRVDSRLILAMAYYTKWASALRRGGGAQDAEQFFSRGQALYSEMATLLYALADSEHTAVVIPALKQRGIKIDSPDRDGVTALGYSILNGNLAAGRSLIRYGSNVNQALNPDGLTPLMLAASRGDRDFVSLLLKRGADVRVRTRSGHSAERIALDRGFKDIASLVGGRSGI
jgi:tetratricopeptide (TPR) repeat protein